MRAARRTGGLQRKFFVALLIVGIVPGMVALWATYHSSTASLKQAIGEGFQEIARSTSIRLAGAVDDEIERAGRLAISVANQQAQTQSNQADSSKAGTTRSHSTHRFVKSPVTAAYLEEWARESRHYLRVTIADHQGLIIASTDPALPPQQADQMWWREAMHAQAGAAYVSNVTLDPAINEAIFHVAVPIAEKAGGNATGAVDLVIRHNLLTQLILPIHIGNTGHAMLLDTQGTPLICPVLPPTAHLIPSALINQLALDRPLWLVADDDAHGGRDAIVGASPVRFSHLLTPSSLEGNRWYAFVRQAPEETYAPTYSLLFTVGVIGFGLVIVLSAFGFVVGYRIVKPLAALQREAEGLRLNLATPQTTATVPLATPALPQEYQTGDEIEDLATTFAAMRAVLEENLRTIRSQQHELIRREKLASVGQLLAALAHDLRNPLGVIRSSAQVVLEGPQEEAIRHEMARYIIDEVDKLSQRLHDFLRYARQKPPDFIDCAAEELMRGALKQWEAQGGHERIRVEHRFGQNLPLIRIDPEQIKEALMNVLINAREAMPDGGTLILETRIGDGDAVAIDVTDTGSGIPPNHLARVFEPFFTTKNYGTGLGLTNVKRLVEDNGGTLTVTSNQGTGTTFTLRFRPAS
ncbi:MAG: Histidine kinase domain-containing protein [Nitrospira sp.]|nr:MAG: Histidine kinase domain-containing protein [Nitrospira sp.]